MTRHRWALVVSVVVVLAGCMSARDEPGERDGATGMKPGRFPVIAILDSGVNPQYPIFAATDLGIPEGIPIEATLRASEASDWRARFEEDQKILSQVEAGVLYRFEGKRLLAITFAPDQRYAPILDSSNHGVSTHYIAAREAPGVWIVSIQVAVGTCGPSSCAGDASWADAMEWVAAQDWIDVVSTSLGLLGSPPLFEQTEEDVARFVAASRAAAQSGKLIVQAGGNTPNPSLAHYMQGPPWIISIGGADSVTRGEELEASRAVDAVSNYTEKTPASYAPGWQWRHGTSFAAPNAAGTLAHALSLVRAAGGDAWPAGALAARADGAPVYAEDFRNALNATAIHWSATDWDPTASRGEARADLATRTLPILAQPQLGWGYVNASLAPEIARRVLENDLTIPPGKEQAAAFQAQWQAAREEYWSRYG